jgi:hypothetical protein
VVVVVLVVLVVLVGAWPLTTYLKDEPVWRYRSRPGQSSPAK